MKQPKRTRGQIMARRISMIFLCMTIPVIGSELILRLAGYYRPQIDFDVQEKLLHKAVESLNGRFETDAFQFDPHLLWKLAPGSNLAGLDIDNDGLLTWERPPAGPRNTRPLVVLCLGDSVTAVTYRTYPQIAERLAAAGARSRGVEVYNAAVPGYTTEQALRLLPSLKHLQPDVVVFCFGWNDHFPALSLPDRDLGASNVGTRLLHDLLKNVRLYQLMGEMLGAKSYPLTEKPGDPGEAGDSRVPLAQFQQNLRDLVATVRGWSAVPVLSTEPENLGSRDEHILEMNQFIAPGERNNKALHSEYNQAVRDASVALKVPLLDLEEEFVRRPRDFMLEPDGIHLTGRGHNHVARLVLGALRNESLITQGDYDAIARAEKHDTTAPDKPKVAWTLVPDQVASQAGQAFAFSVIPQNAGNTRWLAKNIIPRFGLETDISYGGTAVFARWRTVDSPTTGIALKAPLRSDVLPGEATSITLAMKAPDRPGNYEIELGLMSDFIGPLSAYGADSTTLTVTSVKPNGAGITAQPSAAAPARPGANPAISVNPAPAPVPPPAIVAPSDAVSDATESTELPPLDSVPPPPTAQESDSSTTDSSSAEAM